MREKVIHKWEKIVLEYFSLDSIVRIFNYFTLFNPNLRMLVVPSPLLSLVIPTKNRYPYLKSLLRYLSEWDSNELEIVIQDNSSNNAEILDFLSEINDERMVYHYQQEWLSVSDNCEAAIQHATGDYLCMLGDDDGVTPQILDAAKWMKASKAEAILTSKPTYHWPGTISRLNGMTTSGRILPYNFDGRIHKIDVNEELFKTLKSGGTQMFFLPRVYHGVVERSCMDRLRLISGSCFPGPSPDIANAIGLTQTVQSMYFLDLPLIINGNCSSSAGGLGARAAHHGEIHEMNFLDPGLAKAWPYQVPYFWSGPTILAASVVISLKSIGKQEAVADLDLTALYARCLVFHGNYADRILKAAKSNNNFKLVAIPVFLRSVSNIVLLRLRSLAVKLSTKILPRNKQVTSDKNLESIKLAIEFIIASNKYRKLINVLNG